MLDRIYIPSSGTFNISMIPRSASGNLTMSWYDVDDELTLLTTSTLTWSSAAVELTADVNVGDRKISLDTHALEHCDNFCFEGGYFNSVESVDGSDIYAYSATPKKLIGTGETPDSIYPTAASLAIPIEVEAWHQYILRGTDIYLSVYTLDADGLEIPLTEAVIRDEYPTIYNQIVRFRNIKNLITMTFYKDTMPNLMSLVEDYHSYPFVISEIGLLLEYDVIEKILLDLLLVDKENSYAELLKTIRNKRSEKWTEISNLIFVKNSGGKDAIAKKYKSTVRWERGL